MSNKPLIDHDRLLDVREAAAILGLKPATLYSWVYKRLIPFVKLRGKAIRFRLTAIQRLIEESEVPTLKPLHDRTAAP